MTEYNLEGLLNEVEGVKTASSITADFLKKTPVVVDTELSNLKEAIKEHSEVIEISKDTIEVAEVPKPPVPAEKTWTISLKDVNHGVIVTDFNESYQYSRVLDPTSNPTDKFLVFHKTTQNNETKWETMSGLLSNRYVVASLTDFIDILKTAIQFENDPVIYVEPFKCSWHTTTPHVVSLFGNDEASKLIFSLVSGINYESMENLITKLAIHVSNSYDGTRSLRLDYTIFISGIAKNSETTKEFKFHDYFTLSNYSNNIIHTSQLENLSTDLTTVVEKLNGNIEILKGITVDADKYADAIVKCFKKDNKLQFISYYENLTPADKNLYTILLLTSIVIDKNYSSSVLNKIRGEVDSIFSTIFRNVH